MISKKRRLTKKEFSQVFAGGKKIKKGKFLFVVDKTFLNKEKVSVVCSKKNVQKAVVRNKIKRNIYRWISQNEKTWVGKKKNLIIILQYGVENTPQNELHRDLLEGLEEIMITS